MRKTPRSTSLIFLIAVFLFALASSSAQARDKDDQSAFRRFFGRIFNGKHQHDRANSQAEIDSMSKQLSEIPLRSEAEETVERDEDESEYEVDPDEENDAQEPHGGGGMCGAYAYQAICPFSDAEYKAKADDAKKDFNQRQLEYFQRKIGGKLNKKNLARAKEKLTKFKEKLSELERPDAKGNFSIPRGNEATEYLEYLGGLGKDIQLNALGNHSLKMLVEGLIAEHKLLAPDLNTSALEKTAEGITFHATPDAHLLADQTLWNKWIMTCLSSGGGDNAFALGSDIYICPGRVIAALFRGENNVQMARADISAGVSHEFSHLMSYSSKVQQACIKNKGGKFKNDYVMDEQQADYRSALAIARRIEQGDTEGLEPREFVQRMLGNLCGRRGDFHPDPEDRIQTYMSVFRLFKGSRDALTCSELTAVEKEQFCTSLGPLI